MVVYVLPVWTLLLWATRIRNIVADDWSWPELIVPVGLTVLAIVALVRRHPGIPLLCVATVVAWVVRLPLVLVRDHEVGFKVVHTVLAIASVALAVATWRAVSRSRLRVGAPG